jgi:hypothetical protein
MLNLRIAVLAGVSSWPPNPRYILDNWARLDLFHVLLQWTPTGLGLSELSTDQNVPDVGQVKNYPRTHDHMHSKYNAT